MLGGAVAGCVILCRIIVYRTAGGGVGGGGIVGGGVIGGVLSPSAVLFLASSEGSSTLYSGTVYSGSFNGCFGVRSDIVVPFVSSHPAPHAVAQGGSRKVSP